MLTQWEHIPADCQEQTTSAFVKSQTTPISSNSLLNANSSLLSTIANTINTACEIDILQQSQQQLDRKKYYYGDEKVANAHASKETKRLQFLDAGSRHNSTPTPASASSLGALFRETKGQLTNLVENLTQWFVSSTVNNSTNSNSPSTHILLNEEKNNLYSTSPTDSALISLDSIGAISTATSNNCISFQQNTLPLMPANNHSYKSYDVTEGQKEQENNLNPYSMSANISASSNDNSVVTASSSRWENMFYTVELAEKKLHILKRYSNVQVIGSGAQGIVVSAEDEVTKTAVAIKKLTKPFANATHAKRSYRELVLMNLVNHRNVIKLLNTYTPQETLDEFSDIYLVMEFMNANLTQVIQMDVDHERMSFLLYQMLCGAHHLHKAGIVHRDLKPSNIVVNYQCQLKILDFGLARNAGKRADLTPYVVTRYYRAPEVILGAGYTENVDVWSIGCIFAELILGRVLFSGSDHVDQWTKIVEIVGTPSAAFIDRLQPTVKQYVVTRPRYEPRPWKEIFPDNTFPPNHDHRLNADNARDLISRMLVVDPLNRITIKEALDHCYVKMWYDSSEVDAPPATRYDDSVEVEDNVDEWKRLIFDVIQEYKRTHDIVGTISTPPLTEMNKCTIAKEDDKMEIN